MMLLPPCFTNSCSLYITKRLVFFWWWECFCRTFGILEFCISFWICSHLIITRFAINTLRGFIQTWMYSVRKCYSCCITTIPHSPDRKNTRDRCYMQKVTITCQFLKFIQCGCLSPGSVLGKFVCCSSCVFWREVFFFILFCYGLMVKKEGLWLKGC